MEKWTFLSYLQIFRLNDIPFLCIQCIYNAFEYYLDTEEIKLINNKNYDRKNLDLALLYFNVHLFLKERHSMSGGGAERETENPKQAPGSEL